MDPPLALVPFDALGAVQEDMASRPRTAPAQVVAGPSPCRAKSIVSAPALKLRTV